MPFFFYTRKETVPQVGIARVGYVEDQTPELRIVIALERKVGGEGKLVVKGLLNTACNIEEILVITNDYRKYKFAQIQFRFVGLLQSLQQKRAALLTQLQR